jgi:osmotically inducible protein OsmC
VKRTASAVWTGGLKAGSGRVSTGSGALKAVPYDFRMRFENDPGTNPEELVAAAHASCYAMALSLFLANEGLTAESIETTATVTLEQVGEGFSITSSHLQLTARIPGADRAAFMRAAEGAKTGCPVSKLLNATITLDATLA